MRPHLRRQLAKMFSSTDKRLRTAQMRYNNSTDGRVLFVPVFPTSDDVFVNRALGVVKMVAEQLDDIPHSKLQTKAEGPYVVIAANKNTVTIERNGLHTTLSIEKVTLASPARGQSVPRAAGGHYDKRAPRTTEHDPPIILTPRNTSSTRWSPTKTPLPYLA